MSENYKAPRYAIFFQPPIISSFFSLNILLSILFPNTLSLCSFLNARDQVSHPLHVLHRCMSYVLFHVTVYVCM
jgi:hypothetical protein